MTKTSNKTFRVESVTRNIIKEINSDTSSANARATMANIRNSVNRPLTESTDLLALLFRYMPEDF